MRASSRRLNRARHLLAMPHSLITLQPCAFLHRALTCVCLSTLESEVFCLLPCRGMCKCLTVSNTVSNTVLSCHAHTGVYTR